MFPPPTALPLPPPEQLSITQGPLPPTKVSTTAEMAKGKKSIKGGPQPKDKGKGKEVKPLTKAKDTKDALTIKDVASKAKNAESKSKADPKKDPSRVKA
nr:hypothetical protein CFP56_15365 [Quercus suber]